MAEKEPQAHTPLVTQPGLYSYQPHHGFPWLRVSIAVARTARLPFPTAPRVQDSRSSDRMKWAFSIFMGLCCMLTSGGLVYGWGPFQNRLRREWGFQNVLCTGPHAYCAGIQQTFLQSTYCAAVLFGMTGGMLFAGMLLEMLGPRWTAMMGLCISVAGNLTMACVPWEAYWLFLPSLTIIAFGGMCPFVAMHYGVNFWREKHVILCALVSGFDGAGCVYVLLQYVRWVSRAQWFCFFAAVCVLFIVGCWWFLPDEPVQIGEPCIIPALLRFSYFQPQAGDVDHVEDSTIPQDVAESSNNDQSIPRPRFTPIVTDKEVHVTLDDCLESNTFQSLVTHFSVCHFLTMWLGGAMPDLLSQVGDPDYFTTTLYPLVTNATFLFIPFVAQTLEEKGLGGMMGYTVASLQATLALCLVPRLWPQMLTLTAFSIAKSFVYVGFFSFIALHFPVEHYGALVAVALSRALAFGLLVFPLIYAQQQVFNGDYVHLLIAFIVLLTPLYSFALALHRRPLQDVPNPPPLL